MGNNLKVKVIDLGLAQKFNNNDFRFRGRVGKLQYMCPEAYGRQVYDAKAADVYCLGVMLFMMLIGAPPYQAPQPQNQAFNYFVSGRIGDVLKHWKRLRLITVDALDLLNKILRYQNTRISLDEVLNHSFFNCLDEANDEEEKEANSNEIEEKKNDDQSGLLSVNQISADISTMSLEDDVQKDQQQKPCQEGMGQNMMVSDGENEEQDFDVIADDEHKENKDNNMKTSRNTYCDMVLQEMGLMEISDKLHDVGWTDPMSWGQLTLSVLKFEVGLTENQSRLFIQKYQQYFEQHQHDKVRKVNQTQNEQNHPQNHQYRQNQHQNNQYPHNQQQQYQHNPQHQYRQNQQNQYNVHQQNIGGYQQYVPQFNENYVPQNEEYHPNQYPQQYEPQIFNNNNNNNNNEQSYHPHHPSSH